METGPEGRLREEAGGRCAAECLVCVPDTLRFRSSTLLTHLGRTGSSPGALLSTWETWMDQTWLLWEFRE